MEALCNEMPPFVKTKAILLLKAAILGIRAESRYMYLSSCLPTLLKRCTNFECPDQRSQDEFIERLRALADLALVFPKACREPPETDDEEERARKKMQGKVMQSMVSSFLLKLLQKSFPTLIPVTALDFEDQRLKLLHSKAYRESNLEVLCELGRAAAMSSPRPMVALLEEIDMGDPQGDGGGDLETSPLSLAIFVLLADQAPEKMLPHGLPLCISRLRRANILLRSSYVLLSNAELAPNVVNLGDLKSLDDPQVLPSAQSNPCWAQRGLRLFASSIALLKDAKLSELRSASCRWYPNLLFRRVLDSLTSTEDIEQKARGQLFGACSAAMRAFTWTCRCELYLEIIQGSRVDAVIGSVVTLFKDDWWKEVLARTDDLGDLRLQLLKVLEATLSGEVQITDAMDTLTAALNICRLVALSKLPQAEILRQALRPGSGKHLDLEARLATISKQIDAELKMLEHGASPLAAALGDASVNLDQLKRDRITMVAHLVSRVREILAEGPLR
ncbi:Hypothetical protein SCF082_LOCUS23488 [Durusdinium trenchii]|uniref:Uncharacterized protein n=1 Tax=Durusdinium trenchii TaxID=1381693 RepID=A0ABP0LNU6_9DINO